MSKYGAKKTVVDGIRFDSRVESLYYLYVKDLKEKGELKDFKLQPVYELQPKYEYQGFKRRAINYKADFLLIDNDDKETVIDVKGMPTSDAKLKRKMFEYRYPDKDLKWIVRNLKRGSDTSGWITYEDNEEGKKRSRKLKRDVYKGED